METAYLYLAASGILTVLMWTPYILSRVMVWGIPTFLNNYPVNFPAQEPAAPMWAQRAKRAHLNMIETMPAFQLAAFHRTDDAINPAGQVSGHGLAQTGFGEITGRRQDQHAIDNLSVECSLDMGLYRTPLQALGDRAATEAWNGRQQQKDDRRSRNHHYLANR